MSAWRCWLEECRAEWARTERGAGEVTDGGWEAWWDFFAEPPWDAVLWYNRTGVGTWFRQW